MSPLNSISVFLMKFAYCHEQLNMRFKFKKRASFLQLLVRALQFQNLNKGHDLLVTIFLSFSFRTVFFSLYLPMGLPSGFLSRSLCSNLRDFRVALHARCHQESSDLNIGFLENMNLENKQLFILGYNC